MTARVKTYAVTLAVVMTLASLQALLVVVGLHWLWLLVPALVLGGGLAWYFDRLVSGFDRDSEQQRRTEQRLRDSEGRLSSILQSIGAGVIATDRQGRVAFLNPVAERLSGWDLVDALNQPATEVLALADEESGQPLASPLSRVMEEGEIIDWRDKVLLRSRDGRSLPVACTVAPIASFNGMIGVVFVFREISKEREVQRNLLAAKEQAERASRAKSEFLAGMSHEIRTPLTAILGMADLLDQSPLDPEQRRYVAASRAAGESLLDLINGILDLSKIEAGRLEVEALEFDLDRLLRQIIEIMTLRARQKGLELHSSLRWPRPCLVVGDPIRIRQVLVNLIGNAIKFTEQGRVEVEASSSLPAAVGADSGPAGEGADPEKQATFHFVVRDTGIGIAPDKQELVFEDFAQADASTTRRYGGTGLGLAISRKLVTMMAGEIKLYSREGEGSVFTVDIPLPCRSAGSEEKVTVAGKAGGGWDGAPDAAEATGGLRILLAEDSLDNQLLFRAYLKGTGHQLAIAGNGREAVAKFRAADYDLVLMDIRMPEMDGYAATRAIRAWEREQGRPATPVLALTAHAFPEDVRQSAEAGCDGHLVKPIKLDDFRRAVSRHGRRRELPAGGLGGGSGAGPGDDADAEVALQELLADLIPGYLAKVAADLEIIAEALRRQDWPQAALLAHTIKGTGGGYGFAPLSEMAAELENAVRHEQAAVAEEIVAKTRHYLDKVRLTDNT